MINCGVELHCERMDIHETFQEAQLVLNWHRYSMYTMCLLLEFWPFLTSP